MFRFSSRTRVVLALLCAALLASRIAGAHLHLCLDGGEPPVSLHVADDGEHHAEDSGEAPHADRDVVLGGDYLSKKAGQVDLGFVVLALALLLFVLPRVRPRPPQFFLPPRPRTARIHGVPPTRGPPRYV